MKQLIEKTKGLVRGTSTAVLISALIHGGLLLLATGFVVFTIIEKQDAKFVPQKIDRPKMKLKKLRVTVKEQAKPRKTTTRIASNRKSADLPDIQLPEMTGMGAGLEGAIGGFDMMADLSGMTIMGAGQSVGNDFEGTFYDLKFLRDGSLAPGISTAVGGIDPPKFNEALERFFSSGWDPASLDRFYRSPRKLYATQMFIPSTQSRMAPPMFGVGDDVEPALWLVHYKGKIAHKTGGTFRFSGFGDDILVIRLNGEIVLNASHSGRTWFRDMIKWKSTAKDNLTRIIGGGASRIGDWFTLQPGVPVEMEILISEVPGGEFQMSLLVEEEGVDYPENYRGDPILPIFKTMPTPPHLIDEITYLMPVGEADLENGPIFSVY